MAGLGPRPTAQSRSAPLKAGARTATPRAFFQRSGCEMGTCSARSRPSALSADGHTAQEPHWPGFGGGTCISTGSVQSPSRAGSLCTYCVWAPLTAEGQVQL